MHKANAKAKDGSVSRPSVEAKVSGRKAGRQEEQGSPANCGRNIAEQPVQKGNSELYDTSDEQEGEEEDDAGEDDTGEEDAGEGITREDIEEDLNDSEEEEDLEQEEEAVANNENEYDIEEQDGDKHNRV
jgi:hypothetical protein